MPGDAGVGLRGMLCYFGLFVFVVLGWFWSGVKYGGPTAVFIPVDYPNLLTTKVLPTYILQYFLCICMLCSANLGYHILHMHTACSISCIAFLGK